MEPSTEDWREVWRRVVHDALHRGFGVEDIAVILRRRRMRHATVKAVRAEVSLLRAEGRLTEVMGVSSGPIRTAQGDQDHQRREPPEEGDQV